MCVYIYHGAEPEDACYQTLLITISMEYRGPLLARNYMAGNKSLQNWAEYITTDAVVSVSLVQVNIWSIICLKYQVRHKFNICATKVFFVKRCELYTSDVTIRMLTVAY